MIQTISQWAGRDQIAKTHTTSNIGGIAFRIIAGLCFLSFLIGIGTAMLITRNISNSIIHLKQATGEISKGNFDHTPVIHNKDELGDLSVAFREMGIRLKRLEEMYLDASPLTHLPGGIAIENVLKKRIESGHEIAFCVIDLDNFKAFNDYYGYSKGNDVIRSTAEIIEEAITLYSNNGDSFFGHIGGDDFVIICPVQYYRNICDFIIKRFDEKVLEFYNVNDRSKGYIKAKTRQGKTKKFTIMTISIAVVTNVKNADMHYIQYGERAAEVKSHAKSILGSVCIEDRRGN